MKFQNTVAIPSEKKVEESNIKPYSIDPNPKVGYFNLPGIFLKIHGKSFWSRCDGFTFAELPGILFLSIIDKHYFMKT